MNSLPDDDYFGLFTQFQASSITYPNHRQNLNIHVNEAPKNEPIKIHHDSADMLCALPSTTEIFFIKRSNDNILEYLKNDWCSELKKLAKNLKYRHFDQLLSYLLYVPLNHELIESIYENISVFCRVHADYFEKRMTNILKFIILDIKSDKKISLHNNFLVLLMISRIAPTLHGIDRLLEAAFQISVYFLYNNICTPSRALTFCGLVFEVFPYYFQILTHGYSIYAIMVYENLIKIQVENINASYKTPKINFEQKNLLVKKQKFLKQYDPEIQLYNLFRRFRITPFSNDSTAKHRSLKRLHKREFKGAVRKLRKDSVFNAQKQIEKLYSQIALENGSIM
ncbi:hypothetical protein MXB_1773 [Myxobolus squamalis]|nr:hypothetical protein MXB_1773 [Myxobolus squamalis]